MIVGVSPRRHERLVDVVWLGWCRGCALDEAAGVVIIDGLWIDGVDLVGKHHIGFWEGGRRWWVLLSRQGGARVATGCRSRADVFVLGTHRGPCVGVPRHCWWDLGGGGLWGLLQSRNPSRRHQMVVLPIRLFSPRGRCEEVRMFGWSGSPYTVEWHWCRSRLCLHGARLGRGGGSMATLCRSASGCVTR